MALQTAVDTSIPADTARSALRIVCRASVHAMNARLVGPDLWTTNGIVNSSATSWHLPLEHACAWSQILGIVQIRNASAKSPAHSNSPRRPCRVHRSHAPQRMKLALAACPSSRLLRSTSIAEASHVAPVGCPDMGLWVYDHRTKGIVWQTRVYFIPRMQS